MPTIHVLGRLLPSFFQLTFDGLPEVDHLASEVGLQMHFAFKIVQSEIDVTVDLNKWDIALFDWVYIRVFDFCRTFIEIYHFASGDGLTVHLDKLVLPDGTISPIMSRNPALSKFCTFVKFPTVTPEDRAAFLKAIRTILSEPALFMSLHELMQSSMIPHEGITNCARVLDGLRKVASPGLDPKQGWPIFRDIVHVDGPYLQLIFDHAKNTRHGDRSYISGPITTEILHRTHNVLNRFIEYRMRGNQPLPIIDFPLLVG